MKDDDGYYPNSPGDNDFGFHHRRTIAKPLATGSIDDRGRATASTHQTLAGNKVLPTARPAPPAREIKARPLR